MNRRSFQRFIHDLDISAIWTFISIVALFFISIIVILIAPRFVDSTWTAPSSYYQKQMYEISDPNVYISSFVRGGTELQYVYHLKEGFTLLAFPESETTRIVCPSELTKYITHYGDKTLKLTSNLLLLRFPEKNFTDPSGYRAIQEVDRLQTKLQEEWEAKNPNWKELGIPRMTYEIYELYDPKKKEAFSLVDTEGILENWVDQHYVILDDQPMQPYHQDPGVLYVKNPKVFRISQFIHSNESGWRLDQNGDEVKDVEQLMSKELGFRSRRELVELGEHIFAIEGCWYCHTDQTRTLVQDVVLNGSESYPAPPSSPNEYIYQKVTFMGTRRIGPDLSRTGVKRHSRDWHKAHFWNPKTPSAGTIMPSFRHFFDNDPRGTSKSLVGIPNYRFEAIFQYLMTKGTRITPPNQAWWLGKDPIDTLAIIDGQKAFNNKEKK